jgi:hypothetical protein
MLGESVARVSAQQTSPELSWKVPIRPLAQARLVSKLPLAWLKNKYWHKKEQHQGDKTKTNLVQEIGILVHEQLPTNLPTTVAGSDDEE